VNPVIPSEEHPCHTHRAASLAELMTNEDFDKMARISDAESGSGLHARMERERRVQKRAKRVRTTCRWIALVGGVGGIGCFLAGLHFGIDVLTGLGCFLFLPTMIAAAVLFFMGGLAPTRVALILNDRERQILDD